MLIPTTEQELQDAVEGGLLIEDHHTDFKKELAAHPRANEGFAVDLASFSIDGGVIYLGVDEGDRKQGQTPTLDPVALAGLRERVDQIARSIPRPPVSVRTVTIDAAGRPGEGYLAVVVPPSPQAPHMVKGQYRARSDTTNYVLDDAEVTRLHAGRVVAAERVSELLQAEIDRDPVGVDLGAQSHLFVVAQPVVQQDDLLLRALDEQPLVSWIPHVTSRTPSWLSSQFAPALPYA